MEHYLPVDGNQIYVEMRPGGPQTLLFLHQSSGSGSIWEGQWNAPIFSQYTLVRIDLLGHGRSSRSNNPGKAYNLHSMAGIIKSVTEQLTIDNYITVAISLSTNYTGEIAASLKNCKGFFLAGASIISKSMTPLDILLPFEFGDVLFTPGPAETRLHQYARGLIFNEKQQTLQQLLSDFRQTDPLFRENMGQCIANGQWCDELSQFNQAGKPVSLVYGAGEQIINIDYLQSHKLPLWQDKIHLLPHAGHLCNLDQPDLFNQLLFDFSRDVFKRAL